MKKRDILSQKLKGITIPFNDTKVLKPVFFNLRREKDRDKVVTLITQRQIITVVDSYEDQLRELLAVEEPHVLANSLKFNARLVKFSTGLTIGEWVYFPWRAALVHILGKSKYHKLRISRNFNLILPKEQRRFETARIGVAGLNVGNSAAICIALEGGTKRLMKFADNDVLSLSNLNRFNASLAELGMNKAVLSAYQVYEIDPYANLSVFSSGITPQNIDRFLLRPKIDVLIEEMDNLPLKVAIREVARKNRIPVIMVTGNGAGLILDVERFDQKPNSKLLNGYLPQRVFEIAKDPNRIKNLSFQKRILLTRNFMGKQLLVKRLQNSFLQVGKSLAGIPQIAEASYLRGAVLVYITRQIITGGKVPSGRYHIQLENYLKKH